MGAVIGHADRSAQVKSADPAGGPDRQGNTTVIEAGPSATHSERMLQASVPKSRHRPGDSVRHVTVHPGASSMAPGGVAGDISSAAFWLVAGRDPPPGAEIRWRTLLGLTRRGPAILGRA